jgi:hypothetical protein
MDTNQLGKTKDILKKYWILFIGFIMVFAAVLYFIKTGYDEGWIPKLFIVFLGFGAGAGVAVLGGIMYYKKLKISGEIIAGFACGVIYATIVYANFAEIWEDYITLIIVASFTAALVLVTFKYNLRIVTTLGFSAALFAPFIVQAPDFQFYILFIYGILINAVLLFFAAVKKWKELPIIGLIITAIMYIRYFFIFDTHTWIEPFCYITITFLVFAAGILILGKRIGKISGFPLAVLILNLIWYGIWSGIILFGWSIHTSVPFFIAGTATLLHAGAIWLMFKKPKEVYIAHFITGLLILVVAGFIISMDIPIYGMEHVIRGAIWVLITAVVYFLGNRIKNEVICSIAIISWFAALVYWFINAWNIDDVHWFGVAYVPFINPPGLLWLSVAALGFLMVIFSKTIIEKINGTKYLFLIITIVSHIVMGILITFEIMYLWKFYKIGFKPYIVYSICWGMYAFILFLWGYKRKERLFIIFADIVLIFVTGKVFIFDISGNTSIVKAITILITALIVCAIGFLNYKRVSAISFEKKQRQSGETMDMKEECA